VVALFILAACGGRQVSVRVTIPDLNGVETPVPGLVVTFLPYDRDRIIRDLQARAEPRPHTRELDSLFREFKVPFMRYLRLAAATEQLRHERDSLPPVDPRRSIVVDSLATLEPEAARARATLERARGSLGPEIDRMRADVRRWEAAAYRPWDSIVRGMGERTFANPVADTTGPDGWLAIELTNGRWWATAVSIDPRDPNAEWYWNLEIQGDTARLGPRAGTIRTRY